MRAMRGNIKKWHITTLERAMKVGHTEFELGRASNEFDAEQQAKRMGLKGEILNIYEVKG